MSPFVSRLTAAALTFLGAGVLFSAAVVDPGLRNMYKAIRPDNWSWGWVNGDTMRLSPPTGDSALTQIPVRGAADIMTEQQLVALRALTPHQVLRVRALDWQKPVFSDFRCGLWTGAVERFRTDPHLAWSISEPTLEDVFIDLMSRSQDNFR